MSLDFADLLLEVIERNASDLHLTAETIIMALREDGAVGGDNMKASSP